MTKYDKILDFVTAKIANGIAAVLIACIFIIINIEIVCRYAFNTSTLIADEYCGYFFAVAVYAGLSAGMYQDKLIKIDLPGAWAVFVRRPFIRMIVHLAALVLNTILFYAIWQTFAASLLFNSRSIQASRTLLAYPQGAVVAGIGLLFLVSLCQFVRSVVRCLSPSGEKGDAA
ncbi:MAG: TRAP transporter small permease [Planctomycetaceae bacterium]|nr:TRAP transporter small permease [Planctomycetaceae bacterium]